MPNQINERLRELADNSALKQSLVPVLICDENLFACSKSIGGANFIKHPSVRGSVSNRLNTADTNALFSGEKTSLITDYFESSESSRVILTSGNVDGERYLAIIFEPHIRFCPIPEPWYVMSACGSLSETVRQLLMSPAENPAKLKLDCARIARLCDFSDTTVSHSVFPGTERINHIIRTVRTESKAHLDSIGGYLDINMETSVSLYSSVHSAKSLYSLIASLLLAALLVSNDNRVCLNCTESNTDRGFAEISICVDNAAKGCDNITSFDKLVETASPISLELAAIADMADKLDIKINCSTEDTFRISCLIPVKLDKRIVIDSPAKIRVAGYVKAEFDHLFALAAPYLKKQA